MLKPKQMYIKLKAFIVCVKELQICYVTGFSALKLKPFITSFVESMASIFSPCNNIILYELNEVNRGRILGRNPDKSLESFPPCYSQSPLQLCLEIYFFKHTQPLTISTVKLLYIVKEKGGKLDRKPYPLPNGLSNPYRSLKSKNSQDYAQKPLRNCTFMNLALVYFTHKVNKEGWGVNGINQ